MRTVSTQRPFETHVAEIKVAMLTVYSLLLTAFGLTASPHRPYVHELFGPDLLISLAPAQKMHEEVMDHFYDGNYVLALQKLDEAITEVERSSKAKERDAAILLTTKFQWLSFIGEIRASDTAFLRAQSLAETALSTNDSLITQFNSFELRFSFCKVSFQKQKLH